jgi:hypothetical protein
MSDMNQLTDRAERLIDALANAIMKTAEVAAQKIELASAVAEVRQRMAAFGAVLQAVGAQKAAVAQQLADLGENDPAMRALYQHQLRLLSAQEVGILKQAGINEEHAVDALEVADTKPTHKRDGRRFVRVESNGSA